MPVLSFEPEVTGLVETLEFKTSITTTRTGEEQRSRSRLAPRSTVELKVSSSDPERNLLNGMLYSAQGVPLQAPNWWEARGLSQNLSAGTRNIFVNTTLWGDFQAGGYGLLFNEGAYEVFAIGAVSSVLLQMPSTGPGLQSAWTKQGTWVMPLKTAIPSSEQTQAYRLNNITETKLKYTVNGTDLRGTAPLAFPTYLSKTLMNRQNAMPDNSNVAWQSGAQIFDPTNLLTQITTWTRPKVVQDLRVVCKSQQAIWEMRMFFHAIGGRHKAFWLGTGKNDLPPNTGTGAGQTYISIDKQGFVANYGVNPVAPRGHLQVVRKDRTTSQHQITLALVSGNNEHLGISPAMSPLLDLSQVGRVEFLTLCRLQEDTVKITHTAMGRAVFEATVIGVSA